MILLRPDFLAFEAPSGELIPCSAQQVVVELMGDAAQWLDQEVITNASQAVLHYFRHEKGRETVTMAEFVQALEQVLKGLGLQVKASGAPALMAANLAPIGEGSIIGAANGDPTIGPGVDDYSGNMSDLGQSEEASAAAPARRVVEADLLALAGESAFGAELFFFTLLRQEVNRCLDGSPLVLRFRGLRDCVKRIVGTKRWNPACQSLNDQIVDYLRTCLHHGKGGDGCALVVV